MNGGQALVLANGTGVAGVTVPYNSAFALNAFTVSIWINAASGNGAFRNLSPRDSGRHQPRCVCV